jgi:competence protein ComEA
VKEIVVHVTGAVKKPGVYHFQSGMRLYQAVEKAGGFTQDADKEALNLADLLQDADQLNIPTRAQVKQNVAPITVLAPQTARATKTAPATPGKGRVLGKTTPPIVTALAPKETRSASPPAAEEPEKPDTKLRKPGDGVVHLNSATAEDLQRLPGVGEVMAEKILAYRQEIGKFTAIEQLKEVDKIGDKKFAAMEPFLRL